MCACVSVCESVCMCVYAGLGMSAFKTGNFNFFKKLTFNICTPQSLLFIPKKEGLLGVS